jgi:hypothetical protein
MPTRSLLVVLALCACTTVSAPAPTKDDVKPEIAKVEPKVLVDLLGEDDQNALARIAAVDLDGDGNDEILADLDAFEGAYVHLYRWNADASRYESATIAGDGA